ncbi:MAG: ketoacyl-ACP synthase III [Planctomycetia bacterium]|nr:ketoacyl-ACP synthase III [Planctomycetia bacterium]
MKYATIGPISVYFPQKYENIEDLRKEFPEWNVDEIYEKTGVYARHISAADEFCSDMAFSAGSELLTTNNIDPKSIDFLLLCTQTPDYPLPTTACILQNKLGMRVTSGALDYNLGCSGYVYGLCLADGLIRTEVAKRVLLITSEAYTKYIDRGDRSLRTIFGDAATATLVEAGDERSLHAFSVGTDGSGADTLIAYGRGVRPESLSIKPRHRRRWASSLYMDGAELMKFTVSSIPPLMQDLLEKASMTLDQIDLFLMHQATRKMLEGLTNCLGVPPEKVPVLMENYGNTVSSTLPILIQEMRTRGMINPKMMTTLLGFGVGLSWAGTIWQDVWSMR